MWKKLLMVFAVVAVSGILVAAEKESKAKCPLSGKAVNPECTAEHNGGTVSFCCGNCLASFKKSPAKHVAKANLQLAVTGQAKQAKCPFTGGKAKDGTEVSVGGVKVKFCCNKCKGKAASAEDQVKLVFNDKSFKKGFTVPKKKKEG